VAVKVEGEVVNAVGNAENVTRKIESTGKSVGSSCPTTDWLSGNVMWCDCIVPLGNRGVS
jgi:hypothetical protein